MSDEYAAGFSPSPGPDSAPSAPPPTTTDERVEEAVATVYSELAKDEDVSEYAAQRADVDRLREGEELSPKDYARAGQRSREALQRATAEAAQLNGRIQQEWQAPPPDYGQQLPDAEYNRRTGAASERVRRVIPDKFDRDVITETHLENDPNQYVANWLIENDSPVPGEIMRWTSDNSESLRMIAALPPRQRDVALATLQGQMMAAQQYAQQSAQQQQMWQQEAQRQVSRAPPPISRMPSGGALPPKDLHALARNEDISSYAAMRRQQNRNSRE